MQATNRKKMISGFALAVALVAASVIGVAQQQGGEGREGKRGRHGSHGGGLGRFPSELNLTDAQQEQIKQIIARHKESTAPLRERLRAARNTDRDESGTFNEAQVRQAAEARAAAQVELEVASARLRSEMMAVLTPEQRAQYAALRQQREQRRREWQQQRGPSPSGVR